jgi:hypothetical protein
MIHICRGFTAEQWKRLRNRLMTDDPSGWSCAIDVFERRIRERFISCLDALEEADSRLDLNVPVGAPPDCSTLPDDRTKVVVPGFAIMGLCCLLIETLQSFREAPAPSGEVAGPCSYPKGPCIRPGPSTTDLFRRFLRRPGFQGEFDDDTTARNFIRGVRNAVLHEAETRGWVIWRDEPEGRIVEREGDRYVLNRTAFYAALKAEFDSYLVELRIPANIALRTRFLKKMDDIVAES